MQKLNCLAIVALLTLVVSSVAHAEEEKLPNQIVEVMDVVDVALPLEIVQVRFSKNANVPNAIKATRYFCQANGDKQIDVQQIVHVDKKTVLIIAETTDAEERGAAGMLKSVHLEHDNLFNHGDTVRLGFNDDYIVDLFNLDNYAHKPLVALYELALGQKFGTATLQQRETEVSAEYRIVPPAE